MKMIVKVIFRYLTISLNIVGFNAYYISFLQERVWEDKGGGKDEDYSDVDSGRFFGLLKG